MILLKHGKAPSLWFCRFAAVAPGGEGRGGGRGFWGAGPSPHRAPAEPGDTKRPSPRARGSRYGAAGRRSGSGAAPRAGQGGIGPACRPSRGHGEGQRHRPASFQPLFSSTGEKSQPGPKQNRVERRQREQQSCLRKANHKKFSKTTSKRLPFGNSKATTFCHQEHSSSFGSGTKVLNREVEKSRGC